MKPHGGSPGWLGREVGTVETNMVSTKAGGNKKKRHAAHAACRHHPIDTTFLFGGYVKVAISFAVKQYDQLDGSDFKVVQFGFFNT